MTSSTEDLAALERLAKAATPGPWTVAGPSEYGDRWVIRRYPPQTHVVSTESQPGDAEDATYIASVDPTTVLALIDELRQLRVRLIEQVRAAARPADEGLRAVEQAIAELLGVESALDNARERLRKVMPLLALTANPSRETDDE